MNYNLDLHGVKHKDVFTLVDEFIGKHLQIGTPYIEIITGNSNQMKYLVKQVLDDYELYAQEHVLNPGKMTINLT